jgi:hypothetical protein
MWWALSLKGAAQVTLPSDKRRTAFHAPLEGPHRLLADDGLRQGIAGLPLPDLPQLRW